MARQTLKTFTQRSIQKLPPAAPGKRDTYLHPQIQGLKVRVTDSGAKSYVYEGRIKGGDKLIKTIGSVDTCSLDAAERAAKVLMAQLVEGIDPRQAERKAKSEPTFGELFDWYITEARPKMKPSTRETYMGLFQRYLEDWRKRKASQITKADVRELHRQISKRAPYGANRMLALVRSVYNAAIRWDRFDGVNPGAGIERNQEEKRETRLLPSQIEGFFQALEAYPDPDLRDFFTLCLLTGQRKSNILAMRWEDVHLEDGLWIIPDTKSNRPQNVPLLDAEIALLKRRQRAAGKSPWVFPSHGKTGHLVEPKAAWWSILDAGSIPRGALRIHDLRRSLGSFMVDAGASLPTIGKALGHSNPTTTAIYARLCLDPVRQAKAKAHQAIADARNRASDAPQSIAIDGIGNVVQTSTLVSQHHSIDPRGKRNYE